MTASIQVMSAARAVRVALILILRRNKCAFSCIQHYSGDLILMIFINLMPLKYLPSGDDDDDDQHGDRARAPRA